MTMRTFGFPSLAFTQLAGIKLYVSTTVLAQTGNKIRLAHINKLVFCGFSYIGWQRLIQLCQFSGSNRRASGDGFGEILARFVQIFWHAIAIAVTLAHAEQS